MQLKSLLRIVDKVEELNNLKVRINDAKIGFIQVDKNTQLTDKSFWVSQAPDEYSAVTYPVNSIEVLLSKEKEMADAN